ncbi:4-alpha-glucanotransferase [Paucidesulfovibrio gracilis DSM 16080]|uniref:4-alpha-glucanotransferase n=1 Tax=Paucidesulfovibrio gracilis DSM 16080 TaxID=1121449 RepID=A0A1T4W407_9BACT|nr:4-alpha-glucanotransferase [Paucidesulfovibrio gracilis]SKA71788.1 4-alpha-glucanotransferase [Paucidesulfovibrio gracilis DSM 16080]
MKRTSGILLPITALPARFGVGDIGPSAERFAGFLDRAGVRQWQILPIAPTSSFVGDSPYAGHSAFGGDPLLISPERLHEEGLLTTSELDRAACPPARRVDYPEARTRKAALLRRAFDRAEPSLTHDTDFHAFLTVNAHWINDLAFFLACKEAHNGAAWYDWPTPLRDRHDSALREHGTRLAREILFHKFCQHRFFKQWGRLRSHINDLGIDLVGDVPIYVTHDSPDVWCHRRLFKLDPQGHRTVVAGVPPDYFSKTGQRWGNPVFDWQANKETDFSWWCARLLHHFGLHSQIRLDHFRGFAAYWEIPASERTASNGRWMPGLGRDLLHTLQRRTGGDQELPILAENLGIITPDVEALRREFHLPGMHVLQFGFGPGAERTPNAPFRHEPLGAVYTGTHDNNTTRGWFETELDSKAKTRLERFTGPLPDPAGVPRALIRLAMASPASQAFIPAQDLLGLGTDGRLNIPGRSTGNWSWRLLPGELHPLDSPALADELAELNEFYGRTGDDLLYGDYEEHLRAPSRG